LPQLRLPGRRRLLPQRGLRPRRSLIQAAHRHWKLVLNKAAKSAGNSAVKKSIINVVSAYLKLRDSLSGTIDSGIEKGIVANTSNLKSECGS
jgi:hypothetical protein